jgi:hypothetical protein
MIFLILRMYDSIYVLTFVLLGYVCTSLVLGTDVHIRIMGENVGWNRIIARPSFACTPLHDYFILNSIIHVKCRSLSGSKRSTTNHAPDTCNSYLFEVELCILHELSKYNQSLIPQYSRLYVQILVDAPVRFVMNMVVVGEARQWHVLTKEVHALEVDRRQLLTSSTFPISSDLDFDIGGGGGVSATHANTTEYETSRLTLLTTGHGDVQGSVDEQCHGKVLLGSQVA